MSRRRKGKFYRMVDDDKPRNVLHNHLTDREMIALEYLCKKYGLGSDQLIGEALLMWYDMEHYDEDTHYFVGLIRERLNEDSNN